MRQNQWTALLVLLVAVSQVACSKGQKEQCDAACMQFYQSLLKNNPQAKSVAQRSLAEVLGSSSNGTSGSGTPALNDVLSKAGVQTKNISPAMLQAHAASVAAALEADKHNPESPFYEPGPSSPRDMSTSSREPASESASSTVAEDQNTMGTGGGGRSRGTATR